VRKLLLPAAAVLLLTMTAPAQARPVAAPPTLAGCPLFPPDHALNTRIDDLPVHPRSADYIASIGAATRLHADFGTVYQGAQIGIPFVTVPASQPLVPIRYGADGYPDESDPGPMPIPPNAPVEGAGGPNAQTGDRHVLVLQEETCKLYELFRAFKNADNSWTTVQSSIFDLRSNALRPDGWTSADAAGLAVLPALIRYDEVAAGEVAHAIRFAVARSQRAYVWPARHFASSDTSPARPPMGMRFRLKADKDISGFSPDMQVILTAFKRYGIVLADNGSNWYIIGAPDPRWDDEALAVGFNQLRGSDFEAVDASSLQAEPNSARVKTFATAAPPTPDPTLTRKVWLPTLRRGAR
jgi:hypothetical protein